jgi:hypothetical protein
MGVFCGGGITGLTTNVATEAASSRTVTNSSITADGTTVSTAEPIAAASLPSGASPPASSVFTPGTAATNCYGEDTAPTGTLSGVGLLWPSIADHCWHMINATAEDYISGAATTDPLTHKTIDPAYAGDTLKISGTPITSVSGSAAATAGQNYADSIFVDSTQVSNSIDLAHSWATSFLGWSAQYCNNTGARTHTITFRLSPRVDPGHWTFSR